MPSIFWNDLDIGDPIPPLGRAALSRADIVVFAVRSGELGPLHVDEEFARQANYGSISAPGVYGLAIATNMIESWLDNGRLLGIATRFQKLIWPGDVLTAKGVVVRKYLDGKKHRVDCDVWVQNQTNDIVIKGTACCALFFDRSDERKRKGKFDAVAIQLSPLPKGPPRSSNDAGPKLGKVKAVAKQSLAKKPAAKKPGAKKPGAKKPAAKKPAAKKPAAKKPGAKKPAAKKPGAKKPGAKKPAAKKPAAKKPAAKKPAAKKPAAKKPAAKGKKAKAKPRRR